MEEMCGGVHRVKSFKETMQWATKRKPMIVISGERNGDWGKGASVFSGTPGDPRATVLFSGLQALGTRGRLLLDGAPEVKMLGRSFASAGKD